MTKSLWTGEKKVTVRTVGMSNTVMKILKLEECWMNYSCLRRGGISGDQGTNPEGTKPAGLRQENDVVINREGLKKALGYCAYNYYSMYECVCKTPGRVRAKSESGLKAFSHY